MHSLMCRIRTQMASSFRVQILTNKRSAGVLNRTQYPSDVIALVVLWRLRHRLTLQELSEMVLERGIVFSHETVREWAAKLTPILAAERRHRRRGKGGAERRSWHGDESSRPVGLSLPRHRPQWRPDRHHVERALGQGGRQGLFRHRHDPRPRHHGRAPLLSMRDPLNTGPTGATPDQRPSNQWPGARSPGHQRSDPMYARLQGTRCRRAVLPRL
jgi:hypothetical protein